ncbi:DUF3800 domain-containing protein [Nocardioides speluncae]|uniref:DUF3800 domain-containing protein n=1 Tax=Nocardioides speluncae TaxID=2670337 RepID=UPI000D68B7D8|nr:DUF3800 domain-containing protein [Nocardioides speluncae]
MAALTDPLAVPLAGPLEITCDESGSEGERLIGGTTDVFAHASVQIDADVAAACIDRVRVDARSPATEVKASVVLRQQNRRVLEWLLAPGGPLHGNAHVHLTEKVFHLVATFAAPLDDPDATLTLYHEGPRSLGYGAWHRMLAAYNEWVRDAPPEAAGVVLDPLVPALEAAVRHWAGAGRPVAIVHDIQGALTPDRIADLERRCGDDLASLTFIDSETDPRIQVTDFLAGAARRIASEELNGRRDDGLAALLRPYVSSSSIWAHGPSWARIGRTPVNRPRG